MRLMTRGFIALTLVGAFCIMFSMSAGNALASTHAASAGTSSTDCSVCQFLPAVATTTTTTTTTYKEHIHIVKTVKEQIKQYEIKHHVIATINEGGPMSGAGCIDPTRVKRWGFHAGDSFKNTDHYHKYFNDTWQAGWKVCNWHLVKIGGQWYVEGIKANCHNRHVLIPVRHHLAKQTKTVIVFKKVKKFKSVYDKWVTSNTVTTTTTTTTYSCDTYGSGWTLTTENGTPQCKNCPPTPCKAHATLTKKAFDNGSEKTLGGGEFTFTITVNGTITSTTTNAASGSSRDLGEFNAGDNVKVCESDSGGYTPDQVCISHTMADGENFTFSFVNRKSTSPPPSVVITSCDTLNQVPAGQPSGMLFCTINASAPGSFTVNPGIGAVSDCSGGSRQSVLNVPLVAGSNTICYYYYAPDDADQPPTDTLTYMAIVTTPGGTAMDSKSQTFKITYPIRTYPVR